MQSPHSFLGGRNGAPINIPRPGEYPDPPTHIYQREEIGGKPLGGELFAPDPKSGPTIGAPKFEPHYICWRGPEGWC